MYRKIITIHKNFGFKDSEKIYDFGLDNNGSPDDMNLFIYNMLKDMDRKKLINIHEVNELIDYDYGMSFNNIVKNISIPIKNIKENVKIITGSEKNGKQAENI